MILFVFYSRYKYREINTLMTIVGLYAGVVDIFAFVSKGNTGKAALRLVIELGIDWVAGGDRRWRLDGQRRRLWEREEWCSVRY